MLMDAKSQLKTSRDDYKKAVTDIYGLKVIEPRKDVDCEQDMIAIGWYFNLRYDVWRVCPKPKGLDKIYAALFRTTAAMRTK